MKSAIAMPTTSALKFTPNSSESVVNCLRMLCFMLSFMGLALCLVFITLLFPTFEKGRRNFPSIFLFPWDLARILWWFCDEDC